jgi:hypothetical protein
MQRARAKNPLPHREEARRRRALLRGAAFVEHVSLDELYARDNRRCHICKKIVKRTEASMDHLIPVSQGGPHSWANVALAHISCNASRGAGRLPAQLRLVG